MIHVIATVELAPGTRDAFLEAFRANVPHVLAEAGCLEYSPTIDLATELGAQPPVRENVVVVVEKWESLDHLKAHLVAPHMLEYRQRVKSMVQGAVIQVLAPAS